jgi:hypothetical protein
MTSIAYVCREIKKLFEEEAVELAHQQGMRQRGIGFSRLGYLLVMGWWQHPQAGPSALARFAGSLGLHLCKQDVDVHFTERTARWLRALLQRAIQVVVCAETVSIPVLKQFSKVVVEDGSTIVLPNALKEVWRGCGGGPKQEDGKEEDGKKKKSPASQERKSEASLKITVRWDLVAGSLDGPHLQDGRRHELCSVLSNHPIAAGALWLADLGYWSLNWLQGLVSSGAYFLLRYKEGIGLWMDNQCLDLLTLLPQQEGVIQEWVVDVGARRVLKAIRLVAVRIPQEKVKERQEHYREYARSHRKPINARVMQLCQWTIVLTNVPATMLSGPQVFALLRARWQIELLFKLWKQFTLIDEWNSSKPWHVLCEVYAKLLAVVIQHWFLLLSCWDDPNRSLSGAAEILREQVPTLVHGVMGRLPLQRAVRFLLACVQGGCSIPQRRTRLNTSRLLLGVPGSGLT